MVCNLYVKKNHVVLKKIVFKEETLRLGREGGDVILVYRHEHG